MSHGRSLAAFFALLLAAGCAPGGSATPPAPAPQQVQPAPQYPAESSAARHILADAGPGSATSRAPQSWHGREDEDDDGGRGQLVLPPIVPCGNGTYATDCAVWAWGAGGTGSAPALNFCRDAALFPSEFNAPATPLTGLTTSTFALRYTGTKHTPIVSFALGWWNVRLQHSFSGNAAFAPAITVTPTLTSGAARGWLVFFTWNWPADILLVPYAINEIQVSAGSSPLAIPAGGGIASLGAFDCLGRRITAAKHGAGFGFSPDLSAASVTSAGSELSEPVYGNAAPSGTVLLSDDRGARTSVPVVAATPSPTPKPGR